MEGMVPDEERGVATLGGRASLPTMYVENELNNSTVSNAHLRFRKISHEAPNSSNGRFNPCYGTPTTYCSSPRANHKTPDSGIEVSSSSLDTSPESLANQSQSLRFPPHRNLYEDGSFNEADEYEPDIPDPMSMSWEDLKRNWTRSRIRFDSPSYLPKLKEILPVLLLITVLASAGFGVVILQNALRRGASTQGDDVQALNMGGKYEALAYGQKRRREVLESSGRLLPDNLQSETGDLLGGKRASIQYGHDLKNLQAKEETQRMLEVQAAKLEKIIETLALKEGDSEEVANEKKDLLLEKLRESGHFASSKIEPLDIDNVSPPKDHEVIIEKKPSPQIGPKLDDQNNVSNSENPEPVKIRRKRVILQSKSANPLKEFRITELDGEKEDDPFRLL